MKLFYTNYATDEEVSSDSSVEVTVEYTINIFLELVEGTENFFGLIDDNGKCIQFNNEEEKWLLDIPNPPSFENLQAYLNDKECIALIENIFTENSILERKINLNVKLHKVKIMDETLNEVLLK